MSVQPCAPAPALALAPEAPADAPLIEALLDRAFGPGRLAKSSERVREFAESAPELSFCAWDAGRLAGVVRLWRVAVGGRPVLFLGPLAVDPDLQSGGVGRQLVERACEAAKASGEAGVLLVGDHPYFSQFGFEVAPGVAMPGPTDARRVLYRAFAGEAPQGPVAPRHAA
jgi:predicted N-acetyltransferase YhbS